MQFLGDIVDRGPDSRAALDLVSQALERWPASRLILGNHDDWLLSLLAGRPIADGWFDIWVDQGGRETLASYGASIDDPKAARETILERHPDHAAILASASLLECIPGFAFVHAGIAPTRPFEAQDRRDCLKIRAPFLDHVGRLCHVVVHGHSPQRPPRPVVTENRISMDTGAFFSGVLSLVAIDRDTEELRFAAARQGSGVSAVEPVAYDRGLGTALDRFPV